MRLTMSYVLVTAALLLATSVYASTGADTQEERACLDAFMKELAGKYQPAPRLLEAKFTDDLDSADADSRSASWELTATNPRNNRIVARASCAVRGSEAVIEILRSTER